MGRAKQKSIDIRNMVIGQHQAGVGIRKIARSLKLEPCTVSRIIKKFKDTGTVADRKRSGRPRKTTEAEDRQIVITSKRDRRLTAPEITAEINRGRKDPVSVSTVKSRLNKAGLYGRVAVKKPLLRPQNKKKRLDWAKQHRHWEISDWNKVLWSDESKFEIFGSKRRVFVRRSAGERASNQCVVSSVKHGGGSVMVWGCFGNNSLGDLEKIEGKFIKESYKSILQRHAIPSGRRIIGRGFVFQQDNDPKHTSKLCQNYLQQKSEQES